MTNSLTELLTHGSKTQRIHEIIEELCDELGRLPKYREVAERYAAEGGNENTAKTQYAAWKNARLAEIRSDAGEAPVSGAARMTLDDKGRLLVPETIRDVLHLRPGDSVEARVEDGELRLTSPMTALRRAQAIVKSHVRPGVSLAEELIAERRAEARRESRE